MNVIDPSLMPFARMRARQIAGRYGFSRDENEDLLQEIALGHFRAMDRYDASRASVGTFGRRVIDNHLASLIEAKKAQRRDYTRTRSISGLPTMSSSSPGLDLSVEVGRVLGQMRPELAHICTLLQGQSVHDTARQLGISRATLYRRIAEIRSAFEAAGLRQYLPH